MINFRHTDEMIKKLESAGLGYHVSADETEDKLGSQKFFLLVLCVLITCKLISCKACTRKNIYKSRVHLLTIFSYHFYLYATLKVMFTKRCCSYVNNCDCRDF